MYAIYWFKGDGMTQLENIKGIGTKGISLLNKMGIDSVENLLEFYPFRYEELKRSDVSNLQVGDKITIDGIIESNPSIFYFKNRLDKMSFRLNTGNNLYQVSIFNRGFLKPKLIPGTKVTIVGKLEKKTNITAYDLHLGMIENEKITPVYHTIYGVTEKQLQKWIDKALDMDIPCQNRLPYFIEEKYHFLPKQDCIREAHQPKMIDYLKLVVKQLKYEELFIFMLKMNYLKMNKSNKVGLKRDVPFDKVRNFIDNLSFKLTDDQEKCVQAIYDDLNSPRRMNRLVQGDVGSGKTIVSFVAMYINYLANYQSALMAPTEILANQHFMNLQKLFEPYNINVALLTGKTKAKEKKEILNDLAIGKIDVIVGTHALFTDDVIYKNLGLVITDEQHRFGVNQRSNLKNKGLTPDILYMSATPIPRTYALTLYGDMDVSSIHTMPNGRKPVITTLKTEKEMKEILTEMYRELKLGHQVYVIAPLIEESDKMDLKNVFELETNMKKAFGKIFKIGVLHGKMSNQEKDSVMTSFKNNEIQILISTTVIEVGVDVENATMMVIFDSYRFGLSALHQLRGRVGRNQLQSYCILISNHETERLKVLTKTNDGFKISEEDFLLRGSGDLFGNKQSGDMVFKIADLKKDYSLLLKAQEDSQLFLQHPTDDERSQSLIRYVERFSQLD